MHHCEDLKPSKLRITAITITAVQQWTDCCRAADSPAHSSNMPLEWLFGRKLSPEEMLRKNQRALTKAMRDLDRERGKMEQQEKKIIADIKKMAKMGQMDAVKVMAKDLVRTRRYTKKFIMMRAQIQAVSLKITTLKSQNAMAQAMKGVTRAMMSMNKGYHGEPPHSLWPAWPGKGSLRGPGLLMAMGLHNLEEELALFLVFGQPEVEGLDQRHSSLGCVVDDAKSLNSAAGLDVRFLFLPLPRVGGQEVGLDIKSFEEAEGIFRGEGGQCCRRNL
ncbi:Charged multivesicular body protein 2a [Chionoecetes opilio]|uniref:Charged multivesicular body protein 2a n=1 Tax=Chionoecetes opilio TaxID=41210 RepID=A0A8J4Y350_CHIOP|nr:Charged multivesicular body protein 2a [Chionoecetes opilio]